MSEQVKNERLFTVLRAPHLSEKSVRLQEVNQYVFEVAPEADKALVKIIEKIVALIESGNDLPPVKSGLPAEIASEHPQPKKSPPDSTYRCSTRIDSASSVEPYA